MRTQLAVAAAIAAMLVLVTAASASTPKLTGTVGPGYKITLTKGGKKVTKLKAGKYTFVISDKASIHNYKLDGPNGFEKDLHERVVQGHEDDHADPEEGQVQVLLPSRTRAHVRQLHRLLGGSEGTTGRARVARPARSRRCAAHDASRRLRSGRRRSRATRR